MTWYEFIHKPTKGRAFQWDGTMKSVRGHLSDEELEIAKPRLCRDGQTYLQIWTKHGWSYVYQGDWIHCRQRESGPELWPIKAEVINEDFERGDEVPFDPVEG